MILARVIPILLLKDTGIVKTVQFRNPTYIGDPRNAVKIFNEREADELVLLDIDATPLERPIQFKLIHEIASEAFMPIGYGGGINSIDDAQMLFSLGVEKIILCTAAVKTPVLVKKAAEQFGSSSVVICIDYKRNLLGRPEVYISGGRKATGRNPLALAVEMQHQGAGELILNSIDRDGTLRGYDLEMLQTICCKVEIPVIASGGAGKIEDFRQAIHNGGASAVAAGSMFVFQGKHRAVLISYPSQAELKEALKKKE